jgi:peptide/nickel transport system substrate-binding protein
MDPYYHHVGQNIGPLSHIFDTLVVQRPDLSAGPGLATSWKAIDDTTWEFHLRKGVKFHDGSDFTAEDVLFSFKRVPLVPNSPSSAAIYLRSIASMTATDPYRIVFKTKTPDPGLPVGLSQILIMSHIAASGPAPEGKTTAQLNAGEGLVGTGPYRFVSYVPNDRLVVAKNPNYWGTPAPWDKVEMRIIVSDPSRAAALRAGDIDVAMLPGVSLEAVRGDSKLQTTLGDTCQLTYIAMDQHDKTPGVTGTDGRNPFKDARVRKALSLAINRQGLADQAMFGLAKPAAELAPPLIFGTNPDAKPDPFDPEAAKRLLAEAGYPNGFGLTLASPNGLFPLDLKIAQAIAAMWTRVGIHTTVEGIPGAMFYTRRNKLEYSVYATNINVLTGELSSSLRFLSMTRKIEKGTGTINVSNFSDPKVDDLLTRAFATVDDDARRKLVQGASKIVTDLHQVLPVIQHRYAYVTRKDLTFQPRLDMFVTAMQVNPKK